MLFPDGGYCVIRKFLQKMKFVIMRKISAVISFQGTMSRMLTGSGTLPHEGLPKEGFVLLRQAIRRRYNERPDEHLFARCAVGEGLKRFLEAPRRVGSHTRMAMVLEETGPNPPY